MNMPQTATPPLASQLKLDAHWLPFPANRSFQRDPRITAKFWKELSRLMGTELSLSSAHHPQSDGQSEREIQTVITALRGYVNAMGDDWDVFLPPLELAFNSKQQASTGAAPLNTTSAGYSLPSGIRMPTR